MPAREPVCPCQDVLVQNTAGRTMMIARDRKEPVGVYTAEVALDVVQRVCRIQHMAMCAPPILGRADHLLESQLGIAEFDIRRLEDLADIVQ